MVVVQVCEIRLVGGVLAALADAPVAPAPLGAEPLPLAPCLLHSIVPVPGTEHLPQILCDIPLSPLRTSLMILRFRWVVHLWSFVPGNTSLMTSSNPLSPSAHMRPILPTPRPYRSFSISPQPKGALSRLVEDAENLPGLVLPHRQNDIERLSVNAPLPVDLDVHAVDEHHRIIALQ